MNMIGLYLSIIRPNRQQENIAKENQLVNMDVKAYTMLHSPQQ